MDSPNMNVEIDNFGKLPRLDGVKDYIQWWRGIKAYIRREYIELLWLKDKPEEGSSAQMAR